jgi:hypothetical protein
VPRALIMLLVIGAGLVGVSLALGAPFLAIPIVVLVGAGALGVQILGRARQSRQMDDFRDEAKPEEVEFTARDKRTLT